jgi:hypothetical protein
VADPLCAQLLEPIPPKLQAAFIAAPDLFNGLQFWPLQEVD